MLEFMTSQFIELGKLDEGLADLRVRYMRGTLEDLEGDWSLAAARRESREVLEQVKEFYRSEEWRERFPSSEPPEDDTAADLMMESRNLGLEIQLALHERILEIPVVGSTE